ncbi:MAG: DUF4276 family protein [Myxococcota bacterium]
MRLHILVEGQTEEGFVKTILAPHLAHVHVWAVPIIVMTSKAPGGKRQKGGGDWLKWKRHLDILLGENPGEGVRVTTLFDLYGLPGNFPGLGEARKQTNTVARVGALEHAMAAAVEDRRFIPYIQRHEMEALVLVNLDSLAALVEPDDGVDALRADIGDMAPEDVNCGDETAPSKRLIRFVPGYQKVLHGPAVMEATGLPKLRAACPRFNGWVSMLEALGAP